MGAQTRVGAASGSKRRTHPKSETT